MITRDRRHAPHLALAALLALAAAGCADPAQAPTAPSSVLSRGPAPQGGVPAPADSLGTINALGATRFLAFGDSITFGTLSSFDGAFLFDPPPGFAYPSQLDAALESAFSLQDFTVDNLGEPGEYAVNALSSGRFAREMAARRPQGLLLLEGINDLNNGRSISALVSSLSQMIDIARLYNTTVLVSNMFQTCVSVQPGTGTVRENSADKITSFNGALQSMVSGRQNVYVVDMYSAFGNNCGPDGGVGLLGGDGLHPTGSGYSVMASTFAAALRARLPVRGSFQ
jgi:lysophospholipase L1-like esterase